MNLERASERAYSVRGPKSAARLYNDIEYELALGEPDNRLENLGEQALALLENRFPGVQEAARQIDEPPSLSRQAGDALHRVRQRTPQPRPTARRPQAGPRQRSRSRLYASVHAHPLRTVAMVTFFIIIIIIVIKLWAYMLLGVITLAAIKAYGRR
jgi:hypothetical protein